MPDNIRPVNYQLDITPDLERFRFDGQVTIEFNAQQSVSSVTLNVLELTVHRCQLMENAQGTPCNHFVSSEDETLTISLPRPQSGSFHLRIDYQGIINDKMAGFYRSSYQHDGETQYIAVTQFQESSARQAFPCMDHPLYKATFDLTMTVPRDLEVIANTPVQNAQEGPDNTRQVSFERTPVMSTYLLFFGVGAFEFVQDPVDPRVRVATLPGLGHTTELGLTFGRKALKYCEDYYGIDYPLAKMDLIAVPDFAFGAMENWGAITFRENLLLYFAETTSSEGVERICEVIAHEIAHQWFGNLVTPADWKYLWLNESFATYFGFGVVAHNHPDWGTWEQFLHTQTATALSRDGLIATFPIEIPGGDHVVINSSTAPIIYNKGASMLRMIEGYIGLENYQAGVRAYLKRHMYDCAHSQDLWEAFEAATDAPITAMVQSWISQPGYPLINASRDGDTLLLSQQRFTYLSHDSDQTWRVPLTVTCRSGSGQTREMAVIMDGPIESIALPEDTASYKVNAGQTGFYRVGYQDEANLAELGALIEKRALSGNDRWGLQNDLYALARAGHLSMARYLAFTAHYENETEYLPLASMAGHLRQADAIAADAERRPIAAVGRAMTQRILHQIGMTPEPDEPHTRSALRNQILWQAVAWEAPEAVAFGVAQFEKMMAGEPIHPDIAKSVMQTGARHMGETAMAWLKARFTQSPSEHERMNILAALGAFDSWERVEQGLAFALEAVPPRNQYLPIIYAAGNTIAAPRLWDWYQRHLQVLEDFHPLLYERVITGTVPMAGLERQEEVLSFFNTYLETRPQLKDAVELALEYLAINVNMRAAMKTQ